MIIGIDESGTGAWAGPATMVAATFLGEPPQGLRDSKQLSDARRFELTAYLLDPDAVQLSFAYISVEDFNRGYQMAWDRALFRVAERAILQLTSARPGATVEFVIDGRGSETARRLLAKLGRPFRFQPKADQKVPEVSAASIVAKTERNILMRRLHLECPEYGWDHNAGYGVPDHLAALQSIGKTRHHRQIKPLRRIPHASRLR